MAFKKATKQSTRPNAGVKMQAEVLSSGGYPARLVQIVDLGEQKGSSTYPNPEFKLEFRFECLDEFMKDEEGNDLENEPRLFSREVSYNPDGYMGERSNIYKLMDALDGFEKDLPELLGTPATIALVRYKKKKLVNTDDSEAEENFANKITGVTAMRAKDAAKADEHQTELIFFNLDEPDLEIYKKLTSRGEWSQQAKIRRSLNPLHPDLQAFIDANPSDDSKPEAEETTAEASEPVKSEADAELEAQAEVMAIADEDDPFS